MFLFAVLFLAYPVFAQTARTEIALQVLHEFLDSSNTAPLEPSSALVEVGDGTFYGTTGYGGTNYDGTVFKVTSSGVLTPIFIFNGFNGMTPHSLALGKNGDLYGTTSDILQISHIFGTIFEVTTNGVFKALVTNNDLSLPVISFLFFDGTNGSYPTRLTPDNNGNFYGTTLWGGQGFDGSPSSGNGTVFMVTTNGELTMLMSFNGTNGSEPYSGLTLGHDGCFYGTTVYGGSNFNGSYTGDGTVFRITTNGTLTTLVSFDGTNGSEPYAPLTQTTDGTLYGTTIHGGTFNLGTVFRIDTNGNLTTLLSFDGTNGCYSYGGLTQGADGDLYGTTAYSGPSGTNYGTIFKITTNGILTTLIHVNGTNGLNPFAFMTLGRDGNLYGAMGDLAGHLLLDGSYGNIFRLVQRPQVNIAEQDGGAVLSWNSFTNGIYRVEYKSSPTDPAWTPLYTNTASGDFTSFTNSPLDSTRRFYRVVLP